MTDIAITPTSVLMGTNSQLDNGIAGETIAAGNTIWKDANGKLMLADSNHATPAGRIPIGIALNGGALNQPISYLKSGDITIGATLVAGDAYYQSDTPGGICPYADVGTTEAVCLIGQARSTTVLNVGIDPSGFTKP